MSIINIEKKLSFLEEKIDLLDSKIEKILKLTLSNTDNTNKMSNHIDFIEKNYKIVRKPLDFLKNKIEYLMGSEQTNPLLSIDNISDKSDKVICRGNYFD